MSLNRGIKVGLLLTAVFVVVLSFVATGSATSLIMRDGRVLSGSVAPIGGLVESAVKMAAAGEVGGPRPILVLDDNLRRTYFPKFQVAKVDETDAGEILQKIVVQQRVAIAGKRVARVGPILRITEFDEDGRRTFEMLGEKEPIPVVQGITLITPHWTKVEGVLTGKPYIWDMRIATSSIPRATLSKILAKSIDDPKNLDQRLQLVRLLLQAERYLDAQREFELILADFPSEQGLKQQARELKQLTSRKIIDEINNRSKAGQHKIAYALLDKFPSEDVAGETLQKVRELQDEYEKGRKEWEELFKQLTLNIEGIKDVKRRQRCSDVLKEMHQELNINTFDRMADYLRLAVNEPDKNEENFSLAASGWLLGSNAAGTNLAVTLSQYDARNVIRQYLTETTANKRSDLLQQLKAVEGASPTNVAQILRNMKPPLETPAAESGPPGLFTLEFPGFDKEPNVVYHVQLPPEYDPYRRYPTVVTLNGGGTTPVQQLDWWAGPVGDDGRRMGQATRLGYIVIAVEWTKEGQRNYEYSAREHHAVLASLRDACRRFAIDTDRVFLSGHSMGGDAAWDIGLAHPDIWAGVIPIVAVLDRYCTLYWENAKLLPFYIVAGELDGGKTKHNGPHLDRYMTRGYDVNLVEYMGRGHEHFSDEIQRIFDWMGRRKRDFYPKEFEALTMRKWDNFFWWIEVNEFPPKAVVEPSDWEKKPAGHRPMEIKGKINGNNIFITSGAKKVAVYLTPELVDLTKPVRVKLNGKPMNAKGNLVVQPSLEVMLEDARTRADRLHPFWAKIE